LQFEKKILINQQRVQLELDATGKITRQYIYLADIPVAVIGSPQGRVLSKEELSAPAQLAQDTKNILNLWASSVWGSNSAMVWLHTNHLGTPDGPNPYAYVRYNPLKYVDPDGLVLFAFDGGPWGTSAMAGS